MNRAVVAKTTRDMALLLVLLVAALIADEVLIIRALRELPVEMISAWMHLPVASRLIRALLGAEPASVVTATGLVTIGFSYPVLYAITWAFILTVCTRVLVGEIDRGTADLLLTLPISRSAIYASVSVVWMAAGVPLCLAPLAGVYLGQRFFPLWEPVEMGRFPVLCVNLYALYLAIGCVTGFVSSTSSRRGTAIAVVLTALVASFLLDFLVALWPALGQVAFLGLLHYYEPLPYVREGRVPWGDLAALGGIAAVSWTAGLLCFRRRDVNAP